MPGLVPFRLVEVPLDLRTRAVRSLVREHDRPIPSASGVDSLFSRLLADKQAGGNSMDPEVLDRVARHPSDRVYWISRAAWERVMGR